MISGRSIFLKGVFPFLAVVLVAFIAVKVFVKPSDDDPVIIDPALMVLVPPETQMLVGIRVKEITKTPVYSILRQKKVLEPLEEFVARTGINPEKQLYEMLVTFDGRESLVLARAKFNEEAALEPDIKGPGMQRFEYGGRMFIGNEQFAIAFVNSSTGMLGSTAYLRRTVDRLNAGTLGMPAWFKAQQPKITRANYVWMMTRGLTPEMRAYLPAQGNASNLLRLLDGMQGSRIAVDLRNDIVIHAHADMDSPASAEQLASALKGLAGLARLTTSNENLDLLKVYDSLETKATESQVDASIRIPRAQVEKVAESMPEGALQPAF
ncbi:MAG: hypothetical protein IT170_00095 [Bryobacterales bacterium]|nr:hypothetical protein [Bryobacterales bacterium]